MRLLTLKSRILTISSVGLMLASLIVTTFVATRGLDQRQRAYESAIESLVYSTKQAIREAESFDQKTLHTLIERLASADLLKNVSLVDEGRRIISHAGDTYTPPINPANFPQQGRQLIERGQFSVYIEAIDTNGFKASPQKVWLVALADRTTLIAEKETVVRTGIVILLFAGIVSFTISRYLTGQLLRYLRSFEKVLSDVHVGKKDLELTNFKHQDLAVIEELLADIGTQMYNYRTDITEEIEQTTQDLRETLETIEIQNVELDIARKHAVQANNAKSEFLANMSHEIRTPLNGIIGFAKILMRSPLNSQQVDTLRAIQKSSEILLMIINDILDFSKVEAGRVELEQEELNFHELIEDIVVMLAPSAHHKGLELNYLYYEDAPRQIIGDSLRLKQIITNLVNNAVKFTNSGEITLRVMLDDSLDSSIGNLKVAITDTGIGLSETEQTSIFKAFSQADASTARQFGGTGLGLSICRGLVHEMEGEIDFESERGKGSTFWFTLPLDEELVVGSNNADQDKRHALPAEQPLECLVFEPQKTSRQSIQHALSRLDVQSQCFDTLSTLVEHAAELKTTLNVVALVCLDEDELDASTNIEALEQLKALHLSILLFTPTLKSYDHSLLSITDTHALKPVTSASLAHGIASVLGVPLTAHPIDSNDALIETQAIGKKDDFPPLESRHKLLAVDDNEMNLQLVKAIISQAGLEIDLAADGQSALELCENHFYPLILMDIQMPEMDGVACLKELRKLAQYRDKGNVVALTAYALPREKNEFIDQGFVDLITKPLDEAKLHKIILDYLPETQIVDVTASRPSEEPQYGAQSLTTQQNNNGEGVNEQEDGLPIFDWNESVHLSNGNEVLAREFSEKLFQTLPSSRSEIDNCLKAGNEESLLSAVHKLHGVTLLCGIPKLRYWAHLSEHALKTRESAADVDRNVSMLLSAIDELIDCSEHVLAAHV